MTLTLILPLVLGAAAVAQGILNREVAMKWGLPMATIVNTLVLLLVAIGFWVWTKQTSSELSPLLKSQMNFPQGVKAIYLIAGCLGFTLVAGIPFAMDKVGALNTFVGIVVAQVICSIIWDAWGQGISVTPNRIGAALLAIASVVLMNWKK